MTSFNNFVFEKQLDDTYLLSSDIGRDINENWRDKKSGKISSFILALCLNLDGQSSSSYSKSVRLESWIDPLSEDERVVTRKIGLGLKEQYFKILLKEENFPSQTQKNKRIRKRGLSRKDLKSKVKICLDPSNTKLLQVCAELSKKKKENDKILFHYNGHSVPNPSENGEIWMFDENFTLYVPVSMYTIHRALRTKAVYVFDCAKCGNIMKYMENIIQTENDRYRVLQKLKKRVRMSNGNSKVPNAILSEEQSDEESDEDINEPIGVGDIIMFGCCDDEQIPEINGYPKDLFTSCLTTPLRIALKFWQKNNSLIEDVPDSFIDLLFEDQKRKKQSRPNSKNDINSKTAELRIVLDSVLDMIAWDLFSNKLELFRTLFRKDELLASLMKNFLIAERIFNHYGYSPVSSPAIPKGSYHHRLWKVWDHHLDLFFSQFINTKSSGRFFQSFNFFDTQLQAFDISLKSVGTPENELPIIHRIMDNSSAGLLYITEDQKLKTMKLLSAYLDKGFFAIKKALYSGFLPLILKISTDLMNSRNIELENTTIEIINKIVLFDISCVSELVEYQTYIPLIHFFQLPDISTSSKISICFLLASIMHEDKNTKRIILMDMNFIQICSQQLKKNDGDLHSVLRIWICIALREAYYGFIETKQFCHDLGVHNILCDLLTDDFQEVRAAVAYSLAGLLSIEFSSNALLEVSKHLKTSSETEGSLLVKQEIIKLLIVLLKIYLEKSQGKPTIDTISSPKKALRSRKTSIFISKVPSQTLEENNLNKKTLTKHLPPKLRDLSQKGHFRSSSTVQFSNKNGKMGKIGHLHAHESMSGLQTRVHMNLRTKHFDGMNKIKSIGDDFYLDELEDLENKAHEKKKKPFITQSLRGIKRPKKDHVRRINNIKEYDSKRIDLFNNLTTIVVYYCNDINSMISNAAKTIVNIQGKIEEIQNFGEELNQKSNFFNWCVSKLKVGFLNKQGKHADEKTNLPPKPEAIKKPKQQEPNIIRPRKNRKGEYIFYHDSLTNRHNSLRFSKVFDSTDDEGILSKMLRSGKGKDKKKRNSDPFRVPTQLTSFSNPYHFNKLKFHPTKPFLFALNYVKGITIHDFIRDKKLFGSGQSYFKHLNMKYITDFSFINNGNLLLTSFSNGSIGVYKSFLSNHKMVSGFFAFSKETGKILMDWQQRTSTLFVGSTHDKKQVKVWDLKKERQTSSINLDVDDNLTCLSCTKGPSPQNIFVSGYKKGTVSIFDRRISKYQNVSTLKEKDAGCTINLQLPDFMQTYTNQIISSHANGIVKFWDPRSTKKSLKTISMFSNNVLFNSDVHNSFPIMVSTNKKVKLFNLSTNETIVGNLLSNKRLLAAKKDNSINLVQFHPSEYVLAVGSGKESKNISIFC